MKLCDTCIYRNNVEQLKPCIIYRDDCEYYESEEDMSNKYLDFALKEIVNHEVNDVLDKIRAEIDSHCCDNRDRNDGLYIAMKILDKHIKEIEGSNTK